MVTTPRLLDSEKGLNVLETKRLNKHGPHKEQDQALQAVLMRFASVFCEIKGLSPVRNTSYAIVLSHGAGPVSAAPYMYPHHHRYEIK